MSDINYLYTPVFYVDPHTWKQLVESEQKRIKRERWLKSLSPRKRKQEILKAELKSRINRYKYKLPLPK